MEYDLQQGDLHPYHCHQKGHEIVKATDHNLEVPRGGSLHAPAHAEDCYKESLISAGSETSWGKHIQSLSSA